MGRRSTRPEPRTTSALKNPTLGDRQRLTYAGYNKMSGHTVPGGSLPLPTPLNELTAATPSTSTSGNLGAMYIYIYIERERDIDIDIDI